MYVICIFEYKRDILKTHNMVDNIVKIRIKDEPTKVKGRVPIKPLMVIPPMTDAQKKAFIDNWIAATPVFNVDPATDIVIVGTP